MAGEYSWERNLTAAVHLVLKSLKDLGLITVSYERGPKFHTHAPSYRLTDRGRGALTGR